LDEGFDGHGLAYHPERVAGWLATRTTTGPIYTEVELWPACTCRCSFCGVDHLVGSHSDRLDAAQWRRVLDDLADAGNRSVMFAGHGESLLHPDAAAVIGHASGRMRTSVTTNGLAFEAAGAELIDLLAWIRFSINAGDAATYAAVHGTAPDRFEVAVRAVAAAAKRKRRHGLSVVVGVQLVLLDENLAGAVALARIARDAGADYFSVKPYSQHPRSGNRLSPDYSGAAALERQLAPLSTDRFRVVFRAGTFARLGAPRPYSTCLATPFMSFVDARGDVWGCPVFAGDPAFRVGNAVATRFPDLWSGPGRAAVQARVESLDATACREACRLDPSNRYLARLLDARPEDAFL